MNKRREPWADPAARNYLVVGLTAAFVMALALVERGAGMWAILSPLIASAGLVFGWVAAPVFVLFGTAVALLILNERTVGANAYTGDFILAAALTVYCMAHFRVCAITVSVFPRDSRRTLRRGPKPRTGLPWYLELPMALTVVPYLIYLMTNPGRTGSATKPGPVSRDGRSAAPDEVPRALMTVVACAILAIALWWITYRRIPPWRIYPRQWQLALIIWAVLAPIIIVTAVVGYRVLRRDPPDVARLRLLELCWRETRREQRRASRWTAWARRNQDAAPTS